MDIAALARECARLGMQSAFGIPGGGASLELVDALMRHGVSFVTTGHEATAALMSGAVSRLSGRISAAITIKGPGFMNLAPGLLSNAYEGYPMLSMSEAYAFDDTSGRRHKWLSHDEIGRSFVKGHAYCQSSNDRLGRLWQCAVSECPGPVHLELADGPGQDASGPAAAADQSSMLPSEVMGLVAQADRPVLIVGSLALRASWRSRLEALEIPVFSTVAAKGVIPEQSPFAAGVYTGDGKGVAPECRLLPGADLIVAIGVRSGEVLNPAFSAASVVRIDAASLRGAELFPGDRVDGLHYLCDRGIEQVLDVLQKKAWGASECATALTAMDECLLRPAWSPARAYRAVGSVLPDVVHVLDTGNFTVIGEHVLRVRTERQVLGTPNGRYMGVGVGYALGAAIANGPDRPVVLWIGDGGLRAFFGELNLAVEQRLRLLVLVMADGYFGSIRGRAMAKGWTIEPLRMGGRDVRRIADAMGLSTLTVEREEALADAVAGWRNTPHPMLIRCDFDPDEYANAAALLR